MYAAPGVVEFEAGGQPLALTAFNGHTPGSLHILFTDATSGVTTYLANRSLRVAAPGADGTVILDFNRATNLPCAYTEFATCPLRRRRTAFRWPSRRASRCLTRRRRARRSQGSRRPARDENEDCRIYRR